MYSAHFFIFHITQEINRRGKKYESTAKDSNRYFLKVLSKYTSRLINYNVDVADQYTLTIEKVDKFMTHIFVDYLISVVR